MWVHTLRIYSFNALHAQSKPHLSHALPLPPLNHPPSLPITHPIAIPPPFITFNIIIKPLERVKHQILPSGLPTLYPLRGSSFLYLEKGEHPLLHIYTWRSMWCPQVSPGIPILSYLSTNLLSSIPVIAHSPSLPPLQLLILTYTCTDSAYEFTRSLTVIHQ